MSAACAGTREGAIAKGVGALSQARSIQHLVGLGLFMAWSLCMPWARNQLVAPQGAPGSAGALVHGVVLIALAFVCNRRRRDLYSAPLLIAGGMLASAAPLLSLAAANIPAAEIASPALAFAGSLCEGAALALIYLLWNEQVVRLPMGASWPAYAGAFALAPLAYFVLTALPATLAAAATFVLPVLSCALLRSCARQNASREQESEVVSRTWRFPWRPALIMTAFSFAHFMLMHLAGGSGAMGQLGSLVMAGVLLAACTAGFERFDPRFLYKLCPPLMVCALLAFSLDAGTLGQASPLLAYAGFTGFSLFMAFILSSICFRYGVHAAWLFGIVEGFSTLAHAAGSFAGKTLLAWAGGAQAALALPLDTVVVALVLLSMLLLSEHDFATTWGIRPAATEGMAKATGSGAPATRASETLVCATEIAPPGSATLQVEPGEAYPASENDLDARCARIARRYGLTRREEEVLALLAQNRSAQDIEGTLYISHNTAKGHIRHVYAKLGVHSREEACALVAESPGA